MLTHVISSHDAFRNWSVWISSAYEGREKQGLIKFVYTGKEAETSVPLNQSIRNFVGILIYLIKTDLEDLPDKINASKHNGGGGGALHFMSKIFNFKFEIQTGLETF